MAGTPVAAFLPLGADAAFWLDHGDGRTIKMILKPAL